ncbi:hypothetical protein SAMN05444397_103213 [Flavobacterium aquidurense]|nr:hypothetical protein SAMN05444397_103213 [Flavobacterium aquidurense]
MYLDNLKTLHCFSVNKKHTVKKSTKYFDKSKLKLVII